jgi:NAD(P)-dependent dehydrogenase (short-subunit alcohol dehydrogenase family)
MTDGFTVTSTTDEVLEGVDLSGRTALVTGASSGLGLETARSLAGAGATVILGIRDPGKGRAALDQLHRAVPGGTFLLGSLDLSSMEAVRAFAGWAAEQAGTLDILVNNAGVMAAPLGRTADGFELQLGTNHLGHFLLTLLLVPALVSAAPSRVVNVSSGGHWMSDIQWDDPHYRTREYEKWEAYGQAKTAVILFTVELDRRLSWLGVRSTAVHPGAIPTELSRHLRRSDIQSLNDRSPGGRLELKSVEAGAATQVWAATSPSLAAVGGVYLEDCRVSGPRPESVRVGGHAPWALDPDAAARLWAWSEEQVGERLALPG